MGEPVDGVADDLDVGNEVGRPRRGSGRPGPRAGASSRPRVGRHRLERRRGGHRSPARSGSRAPARPRARRRARRAPAARPVRIARTPTPAGPPHLWALAVSTRPAAGSGVGPTERLRRVDQQRDARRARRRRRPRRPAAPCRPRGWPTAGRPARCRRRVRRPRRVELDTALARSTGTRSGSVPPVGPALGRVQHGGVLDGRHHDRAADPGPAARASPATPRCTASVPDAVNATSSGRAPSEAATDSRGRVQQQPRAPRGARTDAPGRPTPRSPRRGRRLALPGASAARMRRRGTPPATTASGPRGGAGTGSSRGSVTTRRYGYPTLVGRRCCASVAAYDTAPRSTTRVRPGSRARSSPRPSGWRSVGPTRTTRVRHRSSAPLRRPRDDSARPAGHGGLLRRGPARPAGDAEHRSPSRASASSCRSGRAPGSLALIVGGFTWGLILWATCSTAAKVGDPVPAPDALQHAARDPLHVRAAGHRPGAVLLHRARRGRDHQADRHHADTRSASSATSGPGRSTTSQDGTLRLGTPEEPPTLWLPVGEKTRFTLTSPDVIHSFWVPAFLFKMDIIPGRTNQFELTPNKAGHVQGQVRRAVRRRPLADAVQRQGRAAGGRTTRTSRTSGRNGQGGQLEHAGQRILTTATPTGTPRRRQRQLDRQPRADDVPVAADRRRKFGRTAGHAGSRRPTTRSIGYMYLITSFMFFLFGGVMALLHARRAGRPGPAVPLARSSTTSCSRCTARSCCCCSRRRCSSASPT